MRKNIFLIVFLQFLILTFAQGNITPNVANIAGVRISEGAYYYPYPAEPGKYVDIYIKVQSAVETVIENLTCYLDPKFPFSVDNIEDSVYSLGNFKKTDIALMRFKVRISENAVTGVNKLKIVCKIKGYSEEVAELPIYIQSQDAVLMITNVKSNPSQFKPGETGTVDLEIENLAGTSLKDITVKLDLTNPDLPFVPVNETIEKRIPLIEIGKKTRVTFNIKSIPNAAARTYKIPVVLSYYDMLGKSYYKNTIISIDVNTEPSLLAVHDQATIVKNNARALIPISIINRGESKIAFTTVYITKENTQDYILLSPNVYYIGDINSDDSEVAEFELYVNTSNKHILIPIKIVYKDAIGNIFEQEENVKVNVFNREDAIKYGYEKVTATDPIILITAGFVLLYLFYKFVWEKIRKKRKTEFNE